MNIEFKSEEDKKVSKLKRRKKIDKLNENFQLSCLLFTKLYDKF